MKSVEGPFNVELQTGNNHYTPEFNNVDLVFFFPSFFSDISVKRNKNGGSSSFDSDGLRESINFNKLSLLRE